MRSVLFACLVLWLAACKSPETTSGRTSAYDYKSQKSILASNGAVVSAHPLASKVGVEVMRNGGNAFDAAIATQFALAVVYPSAGNLGGGGFLVARRANGELLSLDYRETAPAAAHRDMYLDEDKNVIPGKSIAGTSAAGVPGSVAGILETIKYARLSLADLLQPAIRLAAEGFVITANEAAALNSLQEQFKINNHQVTPFQKAVPWKEGDTLVQKELAETLKRIRLFGAQGFYEGLTARLIVAEMQRSGGYISLQDLKDYRTKWRTPHRFKYKGHEIVTMGLPSSGGILLNQMFSMIESRDIGTYKHLSAPAVQLMTEIERRAYADRAEYLGDADFVKVPVTTLTSREYLQKRMKDYVPGRAGSSQVIKPGMVMMHESEETTHISIMDPDGNAIAVTTTLNDSYGSKTVVTGAGFLLNNEMDDFSIKPGEPNLYGAVGGEANAIAPGKRMLSSMSPTIVLKENKPFLVVGTPGGTTIPTSVFQTILNVVEFKLSTHDAVNTPKFHHQWLPDRIDIEPNFPDSTSQQLQQMGYRVYERGSIGRTELIKVLEDGKLEAVGDSRGDDAAEGY